jgi:hypothetical protein
VKKVAAAGFELMTKEMLGRNKMIKVLIKTIVLITIVVLTCALICSCAWLQGEQGPVEPESQGIQGEGKVQVEPNTQEPQGEQGIPSLEESVSSLGV